MVWLAMNVAAFLFLLWVVLIFWRVLIVLALVAAGLLAVLWLVIIPILNATHQPRSEISSNPYDHINKPIPAQKPFDPDEFLRKTDPNRGKKKPTSWEDFPEVVDPPPARPFEPGEILPVWKFQKGPKGDRLNPLG